MPTQFSKVHTNIYVQTENIFSPLIKKSRWLNNQNEMASSYKILILGIDSNI